MSTTIRYVSPLLWTAQAQQTNIRQAIPVVWTSQKVQQYIRSADMIQWVKQPIPITVRDVTALQWTQDPTIGTYRKVTAIQWTQDAVKISVRNADMIQWINQPVSIALRRASLIQWIAQPSSGQLRRVSGIAVQLNRTIPTTSDVSILYPLIQAQMIGAPAISSANVSVSAPIEDNTKALCNTKITVSPAGSFLASYSGSVDLYYHRIALATAFGTNDVVWTTNIPSDTTIHALLPTINSKYGTYFEIGDIQDGAIAAGSQSFTLETTSTSYVYKANDSLTFTAPPLANSITVTNLPGFVDISGNFVDPPITSAITTVNLNGFYPET